MVKQLITAKDVQEAAARGTRTIRAPSGEFIITPMAVDEAAAMGISIDERPASGGDKPAGISSPPQSDAIVREVYTQMQSRLPANLQSQDMENLIRDIVEQRLLQNKTSDPPGNRAAIPGTQAPETDLVASRVIAAVKDRLPPSIDRSKIEKLVREAVASRAIGKTGGSPRPNAGESSRVCLLNNKKIGGETPSVPSDGKSLVAEFLSCGAGAELSAGYLEWEKGVFNRTVERPEIGIVIEGKLRLTADGETMELGPGDMVYFPAGASAKYDAGSRVKIACVNHLS